MSKTALSERMFKILTDHIAEIESVKDSIIKGFYADNAAMGMESEIFFREYTATIENHLKSVRVKKDGADVCPLSIIGSTIAVKDLEDMETFSYRIVLPFTDNIAPNMSQASCLSPMGRALLLKSVGSKITIKTPGGLMNYEIVDITVSDKSAVNNNVGLYLSNPGISF